MKSMKRGKFRLLLLTVLLIALVMVPVLVSAATGEITVYVTVENTTHSGGAWTGVLVEDQPVTVPTGSTVGVAIEKAMTAAVNGTQDYTITGISSGYISAINGLAAGSPSPMSGWMVLVNDWFINMGVGVNTLADGDIVQVCFSVEGGPDLGGSWGNNTKTLTGLAFTNASGSSLGSLSPTFAADVTAYTLTLPEGTTSLKVVPTATNKNFQVRTYLNTYAHEET